MGGRGRDVKGGDCQEEGNGQVALQAETGRREVGVA
jgi:hypothetical protein